MLKYRVWTVPQTAMDLREALSNASQILDEERVAPTLRYEYVPYDNSQPKDVGVGMTVMQGLASMAGTVNLRICGNSAHGQLRLYSRIASEALITIFYVLCFRDLTRIPELHSLRMSLLDWCRLLDVPAKLWSIIPDGTT